MQSLEPTCQPADGDRPGQEPPVAHDAPAAAMIDTRGKVSADMVYHGDDGSVTLIDLKASRQRPLPGESGVSDAAQEQPQTGKAPLALWARPIFDVGDNPWAQLITQSATNRFATSLVSTAGGGGGVNLSWATDDLWMATQQTNAAADRSDRHEFDVAIELLVPAPAGTRPCSPKIFLNYRVQSEASEAETFVAKLLTHWRYVADGDTDDVRSALARSYDIEQRQGRQPLRQHAVYAVSAAQRVSGAALEARAAIVNQPWERSRETVATFARNWLFRRPTDDLIDATGTALLYADLDGFDPDDGDRIIAALRQAAKDQHNLARPIGETQLCGTCVDSLDRPLRTMQDGEPVMSVGDTLTISDPIDALIAGSQDGWYDNRISRVLSRLKPDEVRVALGYSRGGLTWAEAALACDLPESYGERVRRKLHRVGKLLLERTNHSGSAGRIAA